MKMFLVIAAALMAACPSARSQLVLNAGESFAYSFAPGDIPSTTVVGVFPGQNPGGTLSFELSGLDAGEQIRYEMFEGSVSDTPLRSGVWSAPSGLFSQDFAWQDEQGAVRLTGLSGSVTMDSLKIGYLLPDANPGGTPRFAVHDLTIIPVPEPASLVLGAVATLFLTGRRLLTRAQCASRS